MCAWRIISTSKEQLTKDPTFEVQCYVVTVHRPMIPVNRTDKGNNLWDVNQKGQNKYAMSLDWRLCTVCTKQGLWHVYTRCVYTHHWWYMRVAKWVYTHLVRALRHCRCNLIKHTRMLVHINNIGQLFLPGPIVCICLMFTALTPR